jgi:hypothetical protein
MGSNKNPKKDKETQVYQGRPVALVRSTPLFGIHGLQPAKF